MVLRRGSRGWRFKRTGDCSFGDLEKFQCFGERYVSYLQRKTDDDEAQIICQIYYDGVPLRFTQYRRLGHMNDTDRVHILARSYEREFIIKCGGEDMLDI